MLIRPVKRLIELLDKERQLIVVLSIVSRRRTVLKKTSDGEDRLEKTEWEVTRMVVAHH